MTKKGKMTEAEKLAWWAANKAKAEAKAKVKRKQEEERRERYKKMFEEINDPNSEHNRLLRQWHPYFYGVRE